MGTNAGKDQPLKALSGTHSPVCGTIRAERRVLAGLPAHQNGVARRRLCDRRAE